MIKYYYKVDSNGSGCETCLSNSCPEEGTKIGSYLCYFDCINIKRFGTNWIECKDIKNATIKHNRKAKLEKLNSLL